VAKKTQLTISLCVQCFSPAVALSLILPASAAAQNAAQTTTLQPVTVTAGSVSEEDLPAPYAGGQVAQGARLGLMGNQDVMDTPFNVTSYTSELIQNQQARTLADVMANDPSVRFTTSSGHAYENFRIRGFDVNQNDVAINGMYGLAPMGRTPLEFVERDQPGSQAGGRHAQCHLRRELAGRRPAGHDHRCRPPFRLGQ
jgi:iron complex outermembrane receptor protein